MHPETDPLTGHPTPPAVPTPAARSGASSVADAPPRAGDRAESMGRAAREIGHDLNNCLGIVAGRAELVLMQLDRGQSDSARKGLEVILGQVERMKELSDSLRELHPRG